VKTASLILALSSALFIGCPSTLKPAITVASNPSSLSISGNGFSNTADCAGLSLLGLPAPQATLSIGQVECSSGTFTLTWPLQYVGCTPSTSQSAVVLAVDQPTLATASQPTSIPWGSGCVLCGAEGLPVCAGNTCQDDLHPNFQGGQVVCTWNCGHTQGASCTPPTPYCGGLPPSLAQPQGACVVPLVPPDLTQGGTYTCYDHSLIEESECLCVPNTLNTCQGQTSTQPPPKHTTGLCQAGQFLPPC
jgi:hypothetical protein